MKMMQLGVVFVVIAAEVCFSAQCLAKTQKTITGSNAQEIQENAYRWGYDYPIGPLKCRQRCEQLWERADYGN